MPKWWPFGKRKKEEKSQKQIEALAKALNKETPIPPIDKKETAEQYTNRLRDWANQQMESGTLNRNQLCSEFLSYQIGAPTAQTIAWQTLESELFGEFLKMWEAAGEFEKSQDWDEAIKIYRSAIDQGFKGSHPFSRLRVIYGNKLKDYRPARDICLEYVEKHGGASKKTQDFKEWALKYDKKIAK